jgi:hypothetical protein
MPSLVCLDEGIFLPDDSQEAINMHDDLSTSPIDKHTLWSKKLLELECVRDGIGTGIDPGIKETVAVLQLLGVYTRQSCEGHLDHGIAAPWIDLESPDPMVQLLRASVMELCNKADALEQYGEEFDAVNDQIHALNTEIDRLNALVLAIPFYAFGSSSCGFLVYPP